MSAKRSTRPARPTVNLNNTAERGQKVTAEIDIQFDGLPVRTAAVAGP